MSLIDFNSGLFWYFTNNITLNAIKRIKHGNNAVKWRKMAKWGGGLNFDATLINVPCSWTVSSV